MFSWLNLITGMTLWDSMVIKWSTTKTLEMYIRTVGGSYLNHIYYISLILIYSKTTNIFFPSDLHQLLSLSLAGNLLHNKISNVNNDLKNLNNFSCDALVIYFCFFAYFSWIEHWIIHVD